MGLSIPRALGTPRQLVLWVLVGLNVVGILIAGLSFQGFTFRNDVEWVANGTGLEFGEHGLAYTDVFSTGEPSALGATPDLTIEVALRPEPEMERGFRFIAVVHSGEAPTQLLIAQWRDTVIVMNGDDYDNSRRLPRLSATLAPDGPEPVFLVVRSDARGSALYIDGELVAFRADLALRLPTDDTPGRLVLGNNVYGDGPWRGRIDGFAIHRRALDDKTLRRHRESWQRGRGFTGDDYRSAELSYALSKGGTRSVPDRSPRGRDLRFPREETFIEPRFPSGVDAPSDSLDVGLNLLGFIPLGVLLVALLLDVTPLTPLSALVATVALGFVLSGSIEFAQAWIPSRSSSFLDLLLNVAGTAIGAIAFVVVSRAGWGAALTHRPHAPAE